MLEADNFSPTCPLRAPVLLIIYNRPDVTKQVFEAIRKAKPPRLYIAADAPNVELENDAHKCEEARKEALNVDWPCDVLTLFRTEHLGCKLGVSQAIDWFFSSETEGIILEDDCLPSASFFWFCQELLERYRDDKRIMHIAGLNLHNGRVFDKGSYYFSRYNLVWGWATWKQAWQCYDGDMKNFESFKEHDELEKIFRSTDECITRMAMYKKAYDGRIDTWDYQWNYATRINNALAIHPNVNLIKNIGFGEDATHTINESEYTRDNVAREISFPLRHPEFILVNRAADKDLVTYYKGGGFLMRMKEMIPKPIRELINHQK